MSPIERMRYDVNKARVAAEALKRAIDRYIRIQQLLKAVKKGSK